MLVMSLGDDTVKCTLLHLPAKARFASLQELVLWLGLPRLIRTCKRPIVTLEPLHWIQPPEPLPPTFLVSLPNQQNLCFYNINGTRSIVDMW